MNYPEDIAELEALLEQLIQTEREDQEAVARSKRPAEEQVFLNSTMKLRSNIQKKLRIAKAERAYEVISLTLHGQHFGAGTLPLRLIERLVQPLNAAFEQAAWRFWDQSGDVSRISQQFIRQLDLRLAALEHGSTEIVLTGNTAPDLSGISALESALRDIFDLLSADVEVFADRVHGIGIHAAKSLAKLLTHLESEHTAAELRWGAPDRDYRWYAPPTEIARIRALLDEIGQPETTREQISCTVNVLSIRNRIEVECHDTGCKLRLRYHKSVANAVRQLRLGDERTFEIEKTVYPFVISKRKRDTFRLLDIID